MTLTNRTRMYVPLISFVLCVAIFMPLFAIEYLNGNPLSTMWKGLLLMVACVLWLGFSALRAGYELRVTDNGFEIRRLLGTRVYARSELVDWQFMTNHAPPGKGVPEFNALVLLKFARGGRYRGEVTQDQARELARILTPNPGLANNSSLPAPADEL